MMWDRNLANCSSKLPDLVPIQTFLGRAPSTINRDVNRYGGSENYSASTAIQTAWNRALKPKVCKLAHAVALAHTLAGTLQLHRSPKLLPGSKRIAA